MRERYHSQDLDADGRIISKWIFRKWGVRVWTGSSGSVLGQEAGTCECGNEPLVSIKYGEFLD
jgi:hypothetical protein